MNAYHNYTKQHKLKPEETLYTIWIGTNDIGAGELLTGQATPGISIVNVSRCAVDVVQTLYKAGARNFLFQNVNISQFAFYVVSNICIAYSAG
jgi:ABC-type multidrug transport system permease subunit